LLYINSVLYDVVVVDDDDDHVRNYLNVEFIF